MVTTPDLSRNIVHFNVEQAFRGVSGDLAELVDFHSSCDYSFEEGKTYLVYAYRWGEENKLSTNYCTRTKELSEAAADLAYLKIPSENRPPHVIMGVLASEWGARLRQISIVATNSTRKYRTRYRTVSDKEGWFKLILPRAGTYRVEMTLPRHADIGSWTRDEDVADISKRVRTKSGVFLEFTVVVEPGKCAFINPPLFLGYP